jgi:tetratricopeptide (TPR) repeat protein
MSEKTASFLQRRRLHILLIVFLGLLVYSNTFDAPFQFDDYLFVDYRGMELQVSSADEDVAAVFGTVRGPWASRPLLYATFVLNHSLDGFNTWGYHIVNLALHIVNGILLYLLVAMTGRHLGHGEKDIIPVAVLSSLIFVLHPVQTEAVTMVVNRSMLMATTFYLSGLMLFLKITISEGKEKNYYTAGLFLATLLGAASRENFATLPIMLFIYDLFFVSRFRLRTTASHYRAYMAVLLGIAFLGYLVYTNTYSKYKDFPDIAIPPFQYVLTQLKMHWLYLRLLIFPINQNLTYEYTLAKGLFEFPTLLYFIGYIGIWAAGLFLSRRKPIVSFGLLWFLVTLMPISFGVALLNLRLGDPIFEHRFYLPSVGIIMLAALALARIVRGRRALIPALAVLCIVLSSAAYTRNYVWADEGRLWEDVVRKSPNMHRGHNNLGTYLSKNGRNDEAIEHLEIAVKLAPNNGQLRNNLGIAYFRKGYRDKAIEHLEAAVELTPDMAKTHSNLGAIYQALGRYQEALDNLLTAVRLNPFNAPIKNNLAKTYYALGQKEKAIEYYISSLWLDKEQTTVLNNLVVLFVETGQKERAIKHLEALLALEPGYLPARITIGRLYIEEGLPFRAITHLNEALKLRPDEPEAHRTIAEAYREVGNLQSSGEHLRRAEALER